MLLQLILPDQNDLPVELDSIKADLGITGTANDARLSQLIWRATDICEQWTGRTYCEQTFKLTLPKFTKQIDIPRPPLDFIDEVRYYDTANVLQLMDEANFYVVKSDFNNYIEFVEMPLTYNRPDCVQIVFTTDPIQPFLFPATVSLICGWLNENREGQAMPEGIIRLLGLMRDGTYK